METDSSVLLSNSASEAQKIDASTQFPVDQSTDQSLEVYDLIANYQFAALNKIKDVREFLQGEWSGRKHTRVRLLLHLLDCTIGHQGGFFLNTILRWNLFEVRYSSRVFLTMLFQRMVKIMCEDCRVRFTGAFNYVRRCAFGQ
jgi:hypothetical protein